MRIFIILLIHLLMMGKHVSKKIVISQFIQTLKESVVHYKNFMLPITSIPKKYLKLKGNLRKCRSPNNRNNQL